MVHYTTGAWYQLSMAQAGKKEALFKPFLFADQDLDELVRDIAPRGGPLADAAEKLRQGDAAEAEIVITAAMISRPDEVGAWHRLLLCAALERKGNAAGAAAALRQLADSATESRIRLWSWNALRRLGEPPGEDHAARVEGVVVEVEVGKGVDTLAAYADGTARYLLHTGAKVIWDAPDKRLAPAIAAVIAAAGEARAEIPAGRLPGEPGAGLARFTLLTPAGPRAIEEPIAEVSSPSSPRAPLFAAATTLLEEILAIAKW
jgi:hypothetical protein